MTTEIPHTNPAEGESKPKDKNEVERRFLVDPALITPELLQDFEEQLYIDQYYVFMSEDGSEQRTRQIADMNTGKLGYTMTVKTKGPSELTRGEPVDELPIPWGLHREQRTVAESKNWVLQKIRHNMLIDGHLLSLDVYKGDFTGLVIVEVEFKAETLEEKHAAAAAFQPLDWFGEEVTEKKEYRNSSLVKREGTLPMGGTALKGASL
ncbi:MAG: adenylate cyclase [Candidatus Saccharibacteria bacterium]|nr:adenylate cyclase [Candidatus Saccharibacteria bacterium]